MFTSRTLNAARVIFSHDPSFCDFACFTQWWAVQPKPLLRLSSPLLCDAAVLLLHDSHGWKNRAARWGLLSQAVALVNGSLTTTATAPPALETITSQPPSGPSAAELLEDKEQEITLLKRRLTTANTHFVENRELHRSADILREQLRRYQRAASTSFPSPPPITTAVAPVAASTAAPPPPPPRKHKTTLSREMIALTKLVPQSPEWLEMRRKATPPPSGGDDEEGDREVRWVGGSFTVSGEQAHPPPRRSKRKRR
jgi:hypothetical protein